MAGPSMGRETFRQTVSLTSPGSTGKMEWEMSVEYSFSLGYESECFDGN